jgi:hypothetical protein
MQDNIAPVSDAHGSESQEHAHPGQNTPTSDSYFDQRVTSDIIDATRRQVRTASYPNSQVEAQTIKAVDDALFERVRAIERFQIEQADGFLERNKARVGASLTLSERIDSIRIRAENGENPDALAKEFKTLEMEARREMRVLTGHASNARRMSNNLADPIAHAQNILSKMPSRSWQPLRLDVH